MRHALLVLILGLDLGLAGAYAGETDKLEQATTKWREGHSGALPLEIYLRGLVAEDPGFSSDPGLGLQHLGDEMRQVYDGLQCILPEALKAQFLGLSSDSLRAEWLRRYWRLRDPTPTTAPNERRAEHERRVEKAQRDFAWREPPGWDTRGEVLIRFGEPDSIVDEPPDVQAGVGFVPARQDWLYLDEKWVAEFERPNPKGRWVHGRSAPTLSHRPDIVREDKRRLGYSPDDIYYASGRDRLSDAFGLLEERRLMALKGLDEHLSPEIVEHEVRNDLRARALLRKRDEGLWAFSKEYESSTDRFVLRGEPRPPLWYIFDVDVFKGPPGRMRVEVHYQFNVQDLTFRWQDSVYVAGYDVQGLLLDRSVRECARDSYQETLRAGEFRSTLEARLFPGQLQFEVPEGRYRLSLRFADRFGTGEGTFVTDFAVPQLDGRELELSDIEMATKIVYADPSWHPRFVKNDRLVIPNPIGIYRKGQPLTGYFEIYGLQLDESGVARYKVTYSLVPRSLSRRDIPEPGGAPQRPFVSSSFTGEGGTSELVEEIRIDVAALEEDTYDVLLGVQDLVSGKETSARSAFTILN